MSWRTRIRPLLSKVKWPGWVMFIWGIFWCIPELYGKIDFWIKAAKAMGGNIGLIAAAVTSPLLSIFLMLAGIVWLRFAGESRHAIQHPFLPYIGWGFVGIVALAFWSVLVAGYVASNAPQHHHQYVMVNKDGTISKEKNFGEYGLEVTKIVFQGYPAYYLKFGKVPKPLDIKTLAKATVDVAGIESKPNERRVRFIDAGFGGMIVECDFVVWAFE